ncbi:DUF7529 family protein [Natronorubrum tibetense]|uniref:Uncharacterized protein n=1 Tax=Natronorubrum tibetense GA33 TaxID=1114856 RepID=L9W3V9_9EURY|nr:hypothetical protein [Natronorubrum tibetense]ELY43018.1 hypothetical protein C496_06777 [Natronorubrum tibetense GA33]
MSDDSETATPDAPQTMAWKRTLEEMEVIADDRRSNGWEVLPVIAAHTDTVSRDMGEDEKFGLVHVIPGNYADDLRKTYDADEFTEYLAYGRDVANSMFVVTEFIDAATERSILVASRYDMAHPSARKMAASVESEGVLNTYFKKIDGTILGTFEHEEYEPLIEKPAP